MRRTAPRGVNLSSCVCYESEWVISPRRRSSVVSTAGRELSFVTLILYGSYAIVSQSSGAVCESRGGRPGLSSSNKPTVSVDVKQHFNHQQLLFDSFNAELSPERYWYGPRSLEVWEGVRWGGGGGERRGTANIFPTLRCHHQNDSILILCLP